MKFMKLGSRPDTFFTEEATRYIAYTQFCNNKVDICTDQLHFHKFWRAVMSDVPSDLTIKINNITYLLHKVKYCRRHIYVQSSNICCLL